MIYITYKAIGVSYYGLKGSVDLVTLAIVVVVVVTVCGVASYVAADNHLRSQNDDGNNDGGPSDDDDTSPKEKVGTSADLLYNYDIVKTIYAVNYKNYYGHDCTETPLSGYKFVVVDIVVKNNSLAGGYRPGTDHFMVQCEDGNLYAYQYYATKFYSSTDYLGYWKMDIGTSVAYSVVFEIPIGTSANGLSWVFYPGYTVVKDSSLAV